MQRAFCILLILQIALHVPLQTLTIGLRTIRLPFGRFQKAEDWKDPRKVSKQGRSLGVNWEIESLSWQRLWETVAWKRWTLWLMSLVILRDRLLVSSRSVTFFLSVSDFNLLSRLFDSFYLSRLSTCHLAAFLAANSIGAVFSALPTDAGVDALAGRLRTIQPKLLFVDDSAYYNGKVVNILSRVSKVVDILSSEADVLSSDFQVIVHHNPLVDETLKWESSFNRQQSLESWLKNVGLEPEMKKVPRIKFEQLSLSHPCIVVFSSGTTGQLKEVLIIK